MSAWWMHGGGANDEVSTDTPLCQDRFGEYECELLEGHHLPHRLEVSWDYVVSGVSTVQTKTGILKWCA